MCRPNLKWKTSVKFLGVFLDSNLRWKSHVTELSKELSRTVGNFCKTRQFVPLEILKVLYLSLFYSFVSYGIAVWALTYKSLFDPIIVSQKKIIRVMNFKESNSHTEPLFTQLQILKIRHMHELSLLSFMYHLAPTHFHSYFTPSSEVHGYNTRLASTGDLFLTIKTTFQYGIRSIQYSGARLWNSIPILTI